MHILGFDYILSSLIYESDYFCGKDEKGCVTSPEMNAHGFVHRETCESCNMSILTLINIELSGEKHESQCRPINVITVTANICCIASAQLFNLHIFTFSASTITYTIFPIKFNNGMRDMIEPSLENI